MSTYKIDGLTLNIQTKTITDENNESQKLSQSEVYLLVYLIGHQGKTISKNELMLVGWPKKIVVVNSLTVAISNIRRSLKKADTIISNKGIGYSLSSQAIVEFIKSDVDNVIVNTSTKRKEITNRLVDFLFYFSILLFFASAYFATNWITSYAPGIDVL